MCLSPIANGSALSPVFSALQFHLVVSRSKTGVTLIVTDREHWRS